MMSPDPPREESQEGYLGSDPDNEGFTTLVLEDDMMGEGEHELDFSSQPESETSEDEQDDEHYRGNGTEGALEADTEEGTEEGFRARGRYQLLIPFQVQREDGDGVASEDEDEEQNVPPVFEFPVISSPVLVPDNDILPNSASEETTQSQPTETEKREILLSEDKVETIKNVMKGFKLPETAIPGWAKGLSEDSWKTKLVDSISVKGTNNTNISAKKL